jgi:glycosyl hydrolase family 28
VEDFPNRYFSRRKWLGLAATASLGSGLVAAERLSAAPFPLQNSEQPMPAGPRGDDPKTLGTRVYNIRDFGARGDGVTLDTAALQSAIDVCTRDQGGTVLVPAGVFVIGSVEMKSNVTLHIAARGKLLGSADGKQYHSADAIPLRGDSTLNDGNVGLIFAVKAENFTIEGPGTIDGQGAQFRSPAPGELPPAGISGNHRPYHLLFYQCRSVTVRDIFLTQSAYHSIRVIQSSYIQLHAIHIYSRVNHNNDGFHFISCEYVHISDCDIECQDDACALFGSCKFVTVNHCSFSTRWSVFRFGGGVAENIAVSNCLIYHTFGCPIKMRCGPGSRFENMSFSNLVMSGVTGPISINLGPRRSRVNSQNPPSSEPQEAEGEQGIVRNIVFRGIHATVVVPEQFPDVGFTSGYRPAEIKSCIALNGVDAWIEQITFDDVHVTFPGGGTAEEAALRDVPKIAGEYFETGILPGYALYARNVRGLTMSNVRFEVAAAEARPAVVFDHVEDAAINGLSVQGTKDQESTLRFIESRDVLMTATRLLSPSPVFMRVEGAGSGDITVDGGKLSKAAKPLAFAAGASAKAVKVGGY